MDEFRVIYKKVDSEGIIPRFPITAHTVEEESRGSSLNMEEALDILVGDKFRTSFDELDSEENLSRFVITTIISTKSGEDCVKKRGSLDQGTVCSPHEMFVLTEYYIHAGYARGDGDMLAKLTDTHHRVVDQGLTKVGRKD